MILDSMDNITLNQKTYLALLNKTSYSPPT